MRRSCHILQRTFPWGIERRVISTFRTRPHLPISSASAQIVQSHIFVHETQRGFSISKSSAKDDYADQAKELNQRGLDKQEEGLGLSHDGQVDDAIGEAKELQARTPWHREGADSPPVKRMRSAGAMTKGSFCISASCSPITCFAVLSRTVMRIVFVLY